MSDKHGGLQRRVKEIEERLAEIVRKYDRSRCVCREMTQVLPWQNEWFAKEINRRCPSHGVRSLGGILCIRFVGSDGKSPENPEFDRLMKIYEKRQSEPKMDLVQSRRTLRKTI
jgi:hypothetical protein